MRNFMVTFIVYWLLIFCFSSGVLGMGYFWHISDTHVDQNYSRNGNVNNLCHQDDTSFPDVGLFGNFLCDSPEYLVNYTIQAMKIIHPDPDFIIWTGDNLPHTKDDITWRVTYEAIRNTTETVMSTFPGVTILPCIGNHDSVPPDHLKADSSVFKGYLQDGAWDKLLPTEALSTFIKGGYYSYVLKPGLRIVSLNTILWYFPNTYTADIPDPGDQFSWLSYVLSNSSKTSEKVYIIGHVPPGYYNRIKPGPYTPTFHLKHLDKYVELLNDHSDAIIGQFYGHLHMDLFQIFKYGEGGDFKGSSLLASSVTPWHFIDENNVSLPVNPSVRLLMFSNTTYQLLDYDQYYLNLSEANRKAVDPMVNETLYKLLYKFSETYSVPDLSTESLVKVYTNIRTDYKIFNVFFKYLTAGKETVDCDISCKTNQLCAMSSSGSGEYERCMKRSFYFVNLLNFYLVVGIVGFLYFLVLYFCLRKKIHVQYFQLDNH